MKKDLKLSIKFLFIISVFILIISAIYACNYTSYAAENDTNEKQYVFLSDLDYITENNWTYVGWGSLKKDLPPEGSVITLKVNGKNTIFLKGLGMHANAQVVFDISELSGEYTRFVSKAGVDASRGSTGNGVKFGVYVSNDGNTWTTRIPYASSTVVKGNSEALDLDVDVAGYKYLKIIVNHNGNNEADHAVLGGAKLVTADYSEEDAVYSKIHTLEYYDNILGSNEIEDNYENNYRLILERGFVNKVGYDVITELANFDDKYRETLDWLLSSDYNLEQVNEVGEISSGFTFIKCLAEVYTKYKDEFVKEDADVYTKMMIALVAAYTTDNTSSAMTFSHYSANYNYVERFGIIKSMYDEGLFLYGKGFKTYHIDLIRNIMHDGARNDELRWFNFRGKQQNYSVSAYGYGMAYIQPVYNKPKLWAAENKEKYDTKYHLTENGVPYGDGILRYWMAQEEGGICWNLSRNVTAAIKMMGRPSIGCYQPGHEAALYYIAENGDGTGKGTWGMANNIFGWGKSSTKWYGGNRCRTVFNWSNKSFTNQIENGTNHGNAAAYVYLAQANLNRPEDYKKSFYINLLANSYTDYNDKVNAYNKALEVCEINLDSYDYKIQSYKALKKTSSEWHELANDIINNYTFYPMAMNDLLKVIRPYLTNASDLIDIDQKEYAALNHAKVATAQEIWQNGACREVASVILGGMNRELATFSFDGNNAGKIILSSEYDGRDIAWHYSLDGGNTLSEQLEEHSATLSAEELAKINIENDIKIYIVGVSTTTPMYTIDIKASTGIPSNIYANDLENRIVAAVPAMQWKLNEEDEWTYFRDSAPDLTGDKKVIVRMGPTGVYIASDSTEYTFTEDNQPDTRKYIPVKHLSIHAYSTQSQDSNRPYYAPNAIDANINTLWHTDFAQNVLNQSVKPFITIKLDKQRNISGLEFIQRKYPNKPNDPDNIKNARVYVSYDGESWNLAGKIENCNTYGSLYALEFEGSVYGQYVKFEMDTTNMFASVAMINLYEDQTVTMAANFLFDGNDAGKIVIIDEFKGSDWEYSLDGGETWKAGTGDSQQLTDAEIEQVNSEDKIKVRFAGSEKEYITPIFSQSIPNITAYKNDLENRLIGISDINNLEWKIEEINEAGNNPEKTNKWTSYSEKEPVVTGDAKLLIRTKATGISTASETVEFVFTEDNQPITEKYVKIEHLSIKDFSNTTEGRGEPAANSIDGNANTMWHTSRVTTTMGDPRWVIIELDSPKVITKLQYVKKSEYAFGIPKNLVISTSMDGENWEEAANISDLYNPTTKEELIASDDTKDIKFTNVKQAKYVKVECTKSCDYVNGSKDGVPYDYFFSAAMFNLFEDLSNTIEGDFSFDGENAGKIIVNDENRDWQYSLDGGNTWKKAESSSQQLTVDEIENISAENDIKISLVGKDIITTIDIGKQTTPEFTNVYVNDLENRPIGITNIDKLEWKCSEDAVWTSYSDKEPNATGNTTLSIRTKAEGKNAASDSVDYEFTEDNQPDTRKYINISRLSINAVSSEALANSGDATNAIDGNGNTRWHSNYDGTDTDKYIVVEFDKPVVISAMDYVPAGGPNGKILNGQILGSMDGENFTELATVSWAENQETKSVDFEEPTEIRYIKIVGKTTSGSKSFITATMFNFYEDITEKEEEEILIRSSVEFDINERTNKNVTATISFDREGVKVIDDEGNEISNKYVFTENGSHTFKYTYKDNEVRTKEVTVSWIDKEAPEGKITYSTTENTTESVTATISFEEDGVKVVNDNGEEIENTYVFIENGTHTFNYVDDLGNKGSATAEVTWIKEPEPDPVFPAKVTVTFDINERTNKDVTATISFDQEGVKVVNDKGEETVNGNIYVFTENGSHTFYYIDTDGEIKDKVVTVDWIDKEAPVGTITYSTTETTDEDVIATINFNEENVTITNNNGSNEYTFTENDEFTFEFVDAAGNTGTATARVDWINKDPDDKTPRFKFTANVDSYLAEKGSEIVVKVKIGNFQNIENGLIALAGKMEFDTDKLEIKEEGIKGLNSWNFSEDDFNLNNFKFVTDSNKIINEETEIFEITFIVKEDAEVGDTEIKFTSIEGGAGQIENGIAYANDAQVNVKIIEKDEEVDPDISSNIYNVDKVNYIITKIEPGVTVSDFKQNIERNCDITLVNKDGKTLTDSDKISTGTTLRLADTEIVYTLVVRGDTDGDGDITVNDIAQVKLHYIEKKILQGIYAKAADVDVDSEISVNDIAQIKLIYIGKDK